jgi:2-hydroxychromene-2-carboxylate isomerase
MNLPTLDFWFDFASTYSYPAALRIRALADEAQVAVSFRPFLLGPHFQDARLRHLAVQSLSGKGRLYVARP